MPFQAFTRSFLPTIFLIAVLQSCEKTKYNSTTLVDWVPQNTSFVLQLNNPNEIDGAMKNNPVLKSLLKDSPLLSKITMPIGAEMNATKIISVTPYGKEEKSLNIVYKSPLDSTYLALPSVEYSGQKIYSAKRDDQTIFTSFIDGFILHSDTKIILKTAFAITSKKQKVFQKMLFTQLLAQQMKMHP